MSRALAPWLFPVAVVVALLIALTNSLIVYAAVVMVIVWVVLPFGYVHLRRTGRLPQGVRTSSENLPRWMKFDADESPERRPGQRRD